jgi:hypothetical protein
LFSQDFDSWIETIGEAKIAQPFVANASGEAIAARGAIGDESEDFDQDFWQGESGVPRVKEELIDARMLKPASIDKREFELVTPIRSGGRPASLSPEPDIGAARARRNGWINEAAERPSASDTLSGLACGIDPLPDVTDENADDEEDALGGVSTSDSLLCEVCGQSSEVNSQHRGK